jgi:ATP-dependent exoDNAse (exonuclease V) alpha subunit
MLYVAVTRAKKELRLNADLQAWLRQQGCCDR